VKGRIVLLPFPFTDLTAVKLRPALVLHEGRNDIIVAFISSRIPEHQDRWTVTVGPDDPDYLTTGLKCASSIRVDKMATIEKSLVVGEIGELSERLRQTVNNLLLDLLSL